MKISVFLTNKEVSEFTFSNENAIELVKLLPTAEVVVCDTEKVFLKELEDSDAVLIWCFKQEWFSVAKKLKFIGTPAAGKDFFKVVPPKNVTMRYGAFHGKIMAETALGMMLSMSHGLLQNASSMKNGDAWPRTSFSGSCERLFGKTVCILGFGNIGQSLGKLLKVFGCRIIGVRRSPINKPKWFTSSDIIIHPDDITSHLHDVSHLVSFLPSGEATNKFVNKDILSLLPKAAYFYNLGRGTTVDERALVCALNKGEIAGAVLDVFNKEPLSTKSSLRSAKNIFLYPHSSAISPDYLSLYIREVAEELKKW